MDSIWLGKVNLFWELFCIESDLCAGLCANFSTDSNLRNRSYVDLFSSIFNPQILSSSIWISNRNYSHWFFISSRWAFITILFALWIWAIRPVSLFSRSVFLFSHCNFLFVSYFAIIFRVVSLVDLFFVSWHVSTTCVFRFVAFLLVVLRTPGFSS